MTFTANGKIKFLFAKTRRNLIYLSSILVCYLDVSNNFSKDLDKFKNVKFHAFVTRSCLLPFAVNVMLNLSNVSIMRQSNFCWNENHLRDSFAATKHCRPSNRTVLCP